MWICEMPGTGGIETIDRNDVAEPERPGTEVPAHELEALWTP